jgi:tRNA dimethylallyltransferase
LGDAVLIAGPTASGKSAAAIALAERIGGVIVNTDSMQVYAEPRILTARPSEEDMHAAPHLLYGHVHVREPYSAGRYQADAAMALEQARTMKRVPIFVGGTAMYFGVLTDGIAQTPPVPAATRAQAAERREALGAEKFFAELAARDPQSGTKLRASDTQRTLRAWEVIEATGKPLSHWHTQTGKPVLEGMRLTKFVLTPDRAELHRRIDARFLTMMEQGAVEEAVALSRLDLSPSAAKILGLRDLLAAQAGEISRGEAVARAQAATRQYAKRQLTWFRHRMTDWEWLADSRELAARITA